MALAFTLSPTLLASIGAVLAGVGALLSGIAAYQMVRMRRRENHPDSVG